ncbi:MAG: hypothetical protein ABSA76_16135, partial [Bacteroidales bacterium]
GANFVADGGMTGKMIYVEQGASRKRNDRSTRAKMRSALSRGAIAPERSFVIERYDQVRRIMPLL